ncbi:MAG: hypothetical protein ACOX56_01390 [Acholeplasmataceae bacterium]|jgi:hypothetical protein
MKKLTKKTLMAIFALVLAVVALGTTSFAWFTIGQTVSTQQIELDIRSEDGLEFQYKGKIAENDSEWTQYLSTADMLAKLGADYGSTPFADNFKFDAVTSVDGKTFKKIKTDGSGLTDAIPALNVQTLASGILEFKLNFRTKATGSPKLSWTGVTLTSTAVPWSPNKTFTHNKETYGTSGTVTPSDEENYYPHDGARVSVTSGETTVVYEAPNSASNSVLNTGLAPNALDFAKGAHSYYKAMTGKNLSGIFPVEGTVATDTELDGTEFKVNFGSVQPDDYRYVEVVIRVYLEGFDLDTFNAILSGKIQMALEFQLTQ